MKKQYIFATFALSFAFAVQAQVELTDDFESYDLDYITDQADHWRTWSGEDGTPEDGMVVNTYSQSGSQSLLISDNGITDLILLTPSAPTTGIYTIQFSAFIPQGKSGYFNMQAKKTPDGVFWNQMLMGGNVYFNCNGNMAGDGGVTGQTDCSSFDKTFTYPQDEWFRVTAIYDLNAQTWSMEINGVSQFNNHPLEFGDAVFTELAGMDFYSVEDISVQMYIDDVAMGVGILAVNNFTKDVFSLYPNPVTDVLNINSKTEVSNVTIYDILGKQIISQSPNMNSPQIDMSSLSAGVYMVKVTVGDSSKTFKIVK